jgi:hypothetical protein
MLNAIGPFTKQQHPVPSELVYGSIIAVDAQKSNLFTVTLAGATAKLDNPTGLAVGMSLTFVIAQDGTGGRALTFGSNYAFGEIGTPDLTSSLSGKVDVISAIVIATNKLVCTTLRGF